MTIEYSQHIPVMMAEVLSFLQPGSGKWYIDCTLGGGGHTEALLQHSAPAGHVLGIDTDARALARVGARLAGYIESGRLVLVQSNFADLARVVEEAQLPAIHGVLLDLGFSSDQMDDPQRGFSFSADGPLDMRLDQTLAVSAADLVNSASEEELAEIFWRYGEEKRSRSIARRIVRERAKAAITRTGRLATLVAAGVPYKYGAIHPATRVFQALRIAVNHELEHLETVLPQALDVLTMHAPEGEPAGRMVVISFHSLEDRIVKEFIKREATACLCPPHVPICVCGHKARLRSLTTKPLVPNEQEIARNPRARSAKLRAAEIIADQ